MIVLKDTLFLAAPSFRSRAYAQAMVRAGLLPNRVLLLPGTEPVWQGAERVCVEFDDAGAMVFAPDETVSATLSGMGVDFEIAASHDVNSEAFLSDLRRSPESVVIYSGLGGVIVRAPTLGCGKRFLHVHGGWAPRYRGSTAFYYSMLEECRIGATALWLEEALDAGPILARRKYTPVEGVEVDRIQDPLARAHVLVSVLRERADRGVYPEGQPDHGEARTFFVIHPVLKHLALRQLGAS